MPRNRSPYAVANARSEKNTAPRSVRMTAMAMPSTRITTAHTTMTRTFSHMPSSTSARTPWRPPQPRKLERTRGHPGLVTTPPTTSAVTAIVLTSPTTADRMARPRR